MTTHASFLSRATRAAALAALLALGLAPLGCGGDDGSDGAPGPAGPAGPPGPTDTSLTKFELAPGVDAVITSISGNSPGTGYFEPGQTITVQYTLLKDDGEPWDVDEMGTARILVSGPTFNYQRVIAQQSDLASASTYLGNGLWSYTFPVPIPATYLPPYNDTAAFGETDGELTDQPLLDGTYTVGMYLAWDYSVDGQSGFDDVGNATFDFLIGSTASLQPREVVAQTNCNECHVELQAHGGRRRSVVLCAMCHTAGSEDRNDPAASIGDTPGVSIDFRVMIHKLHNGAHLPSVLGVGTNPDGTRNYGLTPQPYQLVGFNNSVSDFSDVGFPVMPSAYVSYLFDKTGTTYLGTGGNGPMPRDVGYAGLSLGNKHTEDELRTGIVDCAKCHGDPDGAGPLEGPAEGDLFKTMPSRKACGSCHDDVDWDSPYTSNGSTMPVTSATACNACHQASGTPLDIEDAHLHPYNNPAFNPGINIDMTVVSPGTGPGGNHQAGDAIGVTFGVTDDLGADLQVNSLVRFQMIVTGSAVNPQWIIPNVTAFDNAFRKSTAFTGNGTITVPTITAGALAQTIAVAFTSGTSFDVIGSVSAASTGQSIGAASGSTAAVSYNGVSFTITQGSTAFANGDHWHFEVVPVASSYTMNVPYDVVFERLGTASGSAESLSVANPSIYWGRQTVWERAPLSGSPGTVLADSGVFDRFLVVDTSTAPIAGIAVGDRVVVDDGTASEEYLQVGRIQPTDDADGSSLGAFDRLWFTRPLRYAHDAGDAIEEVTLTAKREGVHYSLATSGATAIDLLAGGFTAGRRVVASYRTDARFGTYPSPGDGRIDLYEPAAADAPEIDQSWGDWVALPFTDGTYLVGMWVNRDFTVTPLQTLTATGDWTKLDTDNTTYRIISPPATRPFLFGDATEIETREIIASGESCNSCHGDLQAHGNGRRGLDTCLACHATPGLEDGPKYTFADWYVGPTPGVTMDFRTLIHKVHMGEELAHASSYVVNGVFLGTPFPAQYDEVVFPAMPGAASHCAKCHGEDNDAWKEPMDRDHPTDQAVPVREWRAVCNACHDSDEATAHIDAQTPGGVESCEVCHGPGTEFNVEVMHRTR